jgi:hypothetical protein
MSYKAKPNQLVVAGYDATVGEASTAADYNDINTAIAANKYNLLILGTFTQPTQISNGNNFLQLTIAERLKFTNSNVNFSIGSADIKIRGHEIETAYTSGTVILFPNSAGGELDIEGVHFIDTSSGATVQLGTLNKKQRVHNCKFNLPNNATCGFQYATDGSSFTNLYVVGGGSSCKGFILNAEECIIDNIQVEPDTFEANGVMIEVAPLSLTSKKKVKISQKFSIISNILCEGGTNTMYISVSEAYTQVSNISGSITLWWAAANGNVTNVAGIALIFPGTTTTNNNYFSNCKFIGAISTTIDSDSNKFIDCLFTSAFTLGSPSNDNRLLHCTFLAALTDLGTNNHIIETATSGKPLLIFGNNGIFNTTATRYLYAGASDSLAPTSIINMVIPFSGTIKNMHVYHNTPAGNGSNIVYTLVKNGTPASLTVTIPSTTQTASDTSNSVSVVAGDRLAVQVTKAVGIGVSPSDIIVTMEIS